MPFVVPLTQAQAEYPEYKFLSALTPSEQKAAFHVQNAVGDDLCLKIIAPSFDMDRLQREILALQAISHRNVVSLREYTFTTAQGKHRHFLIEDFVAGHDLSHDLQQGVGWTLDKAADFFAALADGLTELRKKHVVHRDLKPSNIRVRPDGSPVIIDFGLARHLQLSDLTRTSEGAAIGTPLYFAPEQFSGTKHDIDHRTDLFALGVLLYQAVVGQHPFLTSTMTTMQELKESVCGSTEYQKHAKFASLPPGWCLLVSRLLEKERGRRPQEPSHVAAILRKLRSAS